MAVRRCILISLLVLFLGGGGTFAWLAWRARLDLVTLDVRNEEIHKVLRKIEWQTWERIIPGRDLEGVVTLNVRKVPLHEVLGMISEQLLSSWSKVYPVYGSRNSLHDLEQMLAGKAVPNPRWASLRAVPAPPPGGGFAVLFHEKPGRTLTVTFAGKPVMESAVLLSRHVRGRVLVEDGAEGTVFLELDQVPPEKAVRLFAKKIGRSSTRLYTLEPTGFASLRKGGGKGGNSFMNSLTAGGFSKVANGFMSNLVATTISNLMTGKAKVPKLLVDLIDRQLEDQLETLDGDQREQAKQMKEMTMQMIQATPSQRQQIMLDMFNNPSWKSAMQERMNQALKNVTPDQRQERYERFEDFKKMFGQPAP